MSTLAHLLILALLAASTSFAQVGTRPAKEWIATLERPDRVAGLKTAEVIKNLGLEHTDIVADLGAGTVSSRGPSPARCGRSTRSKWTMTS